MQNFGDKMRPEIEEKLKVLVGKTIEGLPIWNRIENDSGLHNRYWLQVKDNRNTLMNKGMDGDKAWEVARLNTKQGFIMEVYYHDYLNFDWADKFKDLKDPVTGEIFEIKTKYMANKKELIDNIKKVHKKQKHDYYIVNLAEYGYKYELIIFGEYLDTLESIEAY